MSRTVLALTTVALISGCVMPGQPPAPPTGIPPDGAVSYTCADGTVLPVVYRSQDGGESTVQFMVAGSTFTLIAEPEVDGTTRYSWPSDGSNYIWIVSATSGMLLWHNGVMGPDEIRLADCVAG